ncbi:MAG: Fic family protein [Mycobacteriales bacterium]
MNLTVQSPAGRLLFSSDAAYASVSRLAKAGRAVKLAPGLYVVDATLPPAALVTKHLWHIVAHYWPGAVVSDRSALAGGTVDGWLFLCHPEPPRRSDLRLPGLTVTCRPGPGPLPGDMPMPDDLHLSGVARGLVENIVNLGRPPKGRPARAAGAEVVGDRIDTLARSSGSGRVRNALAELDVVAGAFEPAAVEQVRRLLAAALGTVTGGPVASKLLAARLSGQPYDAHRVGLFRALGDTLKGTAPSVRPALGPPDRWQWLPFFEAYFSNYIEGTIFSLEEARNIALHDEVPAGRPADAHDVSATYRLVSDVAAMETVPASADEFRDLLRDRHRVLMAGRPEKKPGDFKVERNFAGGYEFVQPEQLLGTLKAGFDLLAEQTDPFHRAVFMMFLVSECHPFDDGNGRLARLMANAELAARGQVRIVVPSAYRGNYLAALSGTSNGAGRGESLITALDFTRQWVAAVNWSSWEAALADLDSTYATLDSSVGEQTGRRLRLPPAS